MRLNFKGLFIVLTISLFFVMLHIVFNSNSLLSQFEVYNRERVQKIFSKHEAAIDANMRLIHDDVCKNGVYNQIDVSKYISDSQYSYYVFRHDTLMAWYNAVLPIADISQKTFERKFVHFDNGWYYIAQLPSDTISVYGLFCVKSRYAFENEYLSGALNPSFGLSPNLRVVRAADTQGCRINDSDGNYIFTIKLSERIEQPKLIVLFDFLSILLAVTSLLLAIFMSVKLMVSVGWRNLALLWSFIALAMLYLLALCINISPQMSDWFVFSPSVFAFASWMPSLAYLLLMASIITIWCYWVFRFFDFGLIEKKYDLLKCRKRVYFILLILILFVYIGLNVAIDVIVKHSVDLAIYIGSLDVSSASLIKLVVISLLTLSFIFVLDRVYVEVVPLLNWKKFLFTLFSFSVIVLLPTSLLLNWLGYHVFVAFIVLNVIYYCVKRNSELGLKYSTFVWLMFVFALFVIGRMSLLNIDKEHKTCDLLIHNLSFQLMREDDPIAEMLLLQMENNIRTDSVLVDAFSKADIDSRLIYNHLRERYFDGYFTRYDLQVVPCLGSSSSIQITGSDDRYNCYSYFSNMVSIFGNRIDTHSNFYCLKDNDGCASYFGQFAFFQNKTGNWMRLYIEINAKPLSLGLGYPELLTNSRDRVNIKPLHGYSYAKYINGRLVAKHGNYNYNVSDTWFKIPDSGKKECVNYDGFSHIIYSVADNQIVVLSYAQLTVHQFIVDFSYVFLSMFLIISFVLICIGRRNNLLFRHFTIQERIQFSFIMFVMLMLILMCIISGFYTANQFNDRSRSQMSAKLHSVIQELDSSIGEMYSVGYDVSDIIDNQLQRCSNIFMADVHFYSPEGRLISTSRRELFDMGVSAPLMNSNALAHFHADHKSEYIIEESIGKLNYYSCYSPFFNSSGVLLGYVDIPFFMGADALHEQILSMVMAATNGYLIFVILAICFAILISRRIVSPLLSISQGLKSIDLGKNNVKINYKGNDEIGLLVSEYNRMLDELALSAEKLAISEREMTWREMAKQIAHEIKNPLTPMKLSVQYLLKAWNEKRDDYDTYLRRVAATLIEQIDQLTIIASEFSSMAKTTTGLPSDIDVIERVKNAVALFERTDGANIEFNCVNVDKAIVFANGEQLTSVFNNLIKNALQAADPAKDSVNIVINAVQEDSKIIISVKDNGKGVDEEVRDKIFKPNFTTKSTGMGLGLAIVKANVVGLKGNIWFETEIGVGTCFYVSLPLKS